MSKKRPGVKAAERLLQSSDCDLWNRVESQFFDVLESVTELQEANDDYEALRLKFVDKEDCKAFLTKDELMMVVRWKFSVGKKRPALIKYLHSNSEASVQKSSKLAIAQARNIEISQTKDNTQSIKNAIAQLTDLKGVGPATASAVLTMIRPDLYCYMYDECIDSFLPKRTYTLPVYMKVNEDCKEIANRMKGWTTSRIARVLWTAARICAYGKEDYTFKVTEGTKENEDIAKSRKRRRKK
jgi:hypothetical protein